MEKNIIKNLSDKKINSKNLLEVRKKLKNYETSYGKYEASELRKAILQDKSPFYIPGHFIVGSEPGTNIFHNDKKEPITIERPVDAIIVDAAKEEQEAELPVSDALIILDKNEWDNIPPGLDILQNLRIGQVFLPPHSVIFNLLNRTKEQEKEKIVSMLEGVNINMLSPDNFLDNAFHEIGHLFYRTCVRADEKKLFEARFRNLGTSAIFNYEWERSDSEEFFCTVYKWYLKSFLLNSSFKNILQHEEPKGLAIFQSILDRITDDKIINSAWEINQKAVQGYFNPKRDSSSGKFIRRREDIDVVKEAIVPDGILSNNLVKLLKGVEYVEVKDLVIPVKGNRILTDLIPMQKAKEKPTIYVDMDGVVANFRAGYKKACNRSADKDDPFTIKQFVLSFPNFFYCLPVLDKGAELVESLKDKYNIVFLTTPMEGVQECRRDKIDWIKDNFGDYDIIFSDSKADFVTDETSILIDDMGYNLNPWADAGGTAINSSLKNSKIIEKIESVLNPTQELQRQLNKMIVDMNPTEAQKESGNYKKGKITFKGLNIRIENPKNSIRFGFDEKGKRWISRMKHHYGYITGTEGADLDPVDCFIGDTTGSLAFVVNQINPDSELFDEHKIMLGFKSLEEARDAYLANYEKNWQGLESIKQTNTKKLREWLKIGNLKEPF